MYGIARVNIKGEPPSTFMFYVYFIYACKIYLCTSVRTYKLRNSENPSVYRQVRLKAMLKETICSEIFRATMVVQQLKAMWERCVALKIYVANCSL